MSTANTALLRQWQILQCLPKAPCRITAGQVWQRLEAQGDTVSKRAVERDLQFLSSIFPIECDDRAKPFGWSWQRNAQALSVPCLNLNEALTFELARQYLVPLLPNSTLAQLKPYFDMAGKVLEAESGKQAGTGWPDKVRVVLPTQPLLAPATKEDVQRTVYESLLHDQQMQISYRKKAAAELCHYRVHPLAIVHRGQVSYLVCQLNDEDKVKMLALHRIQHAESLMISARRPDGFEVDAYIDSGAFGFAAGDKKIRLEAVFTAMAGNHLYETPLSSDQRIEKLPDGRLKIMATVRDTPQLHWWLNGFGDEVEVACPK